MKRLIIVGILASLFVGCGDSEQKEDIEFEKDLASSENLVLGTFSRRLDTGYAIRFRFPKKAGARYVIETDTHYGDFDLYGHWRPDAQPRSGLTKSLNSGTERDKIEFTAQSDGDYYIWFYAYKGGKATIEFHEYEQYGPSKPEERPTDIVDGFDYPVGLSRKNGGDGKETWRRGDDDHYGTLDFRQNNPDIANGHCGEDWLSEVSKVNGAVDVYAIANGRVKFAGETKNGIGNAVTIVHRMPGHPDPNYEKVQSAYWHLWTMDVEAGEYVKRGQKIGTIGDGRTPQQSSWVRYTPHLHFEIRWKDDAIATFENGYGCFNDSSGMTDPSEFIERYRNWSR